MHTFIANGKMNRSFNEDRQLAQTYRDQSTALQTERSAFIICPSLDAFASCTGIVPNSPIKIGAQTVYRYDL
jgi:triosephosphate isomerase